MAERSAPVTVQAQVDRRRATVGDPIRLTIRATRAEGVRVLPPPPGVGLGKLEVQDYQVSEQEGPDGRKQTVVVYTLAAYETGDLRVPSVKIDYLRPDGRPGFTQTNEIPITIESVLPRDKKPEELDIKDIKPPVDVSSGPARVWPWVVGVLAAAVVGLLAWLLWRRFRREQVEMAAAAPAIAPERIALGALDELEGAGLLEAGKVKEYHVRLSEVLRRYLEDRFGVLAMECTTGELVGLARRQDILRDHVEGLEFVLTTCDLAKFAKFRPPLEQSEAGLKEARWIVTETARKAAALEAASRRQAAAA